jgi:glycosyltransferase involved in cell wall biosynthesis
MRIRPDIVHVHNFFPLVSPSVYDACREAGIPVVQSLHNYRIICPGALLLRKDTPCELCVRASPYLSVVHRCYRNSWLGTLAAARMVQHHRLHGTWLEKVDCFIALTEFARTKFVEGGLPADRIEVKPNFLTPDPGTGMGGGEYALFVGRLSREKGIALLLRAWAELKRGIDLKIVGSGPLAAQTARASRHLGSVQYLGYRRKEEVIALMKQASFLVLPSLCYESLPMAVIEAFAVGLPVLSSRIGSLGNVIRDGLTGLHFRPNDQEDLCAKVDWLLSHPSQLSGMREAARAEYIENYTAQRNYEKLMAIYERLTGRLSHGSRRHD